MKTQVNEVIDILKAVTIDTEEATSVFKSCNMDLDSLTNHIDDVVHGLKEVHQNLYEHNNEQINIENLTKCKDYYYETGLNELEEESFIEATHSLFDIYCGNDNMSYVKEIALATFGESFEDLFDMANEDEFDLESHVRSELWNFININDDELHEMYMTAFAHDLNYLKDMLDEHTLKLVKIHQYVYQYDDSKFTTISGDSIPILCELFYQNRHESDLLRNASFMGAIGILNDVIDKKILDRVVINNLIEVLFENDDSDEFDYFKGLTDFDNDKHLTDDEIKDIDSLIERLTQLKKGKSITLHPVDSLYLSEAVNNITAKKIRKYDELEDQFNDFHREVTNFYDELQDLYAHGYNIDTPEHDVLHIIDRLFDKHVKL